VTIASHCLALLHEHGPLTPEELGAACRDAGVTASRHPEQAVISALNWHQDGRAFRVGDRFRAVTDLLEGRWLTFAAPDDPENLTPDVDLACLTRLVQREGLPLAGGGIVKARRYSYATWTGPDGWLPAGETLGLQLLGGTAQVSMVVVDAAAEHRGERLAELLAKASSHRSNGYFERHQAAGPGLLTLLANEDDLLLDAVDEAIAVATGASCPLQISHLKTQGPRNWPKIDALLDRVESAKRGGLDVAFDRYPYVAYQTGLSNLFPAALRDGGTDAFLRRRVRIRSAMAG